MQVAKTRPGVGVATILISAKHPNCVLLGKRKGKMGNGLFQLPGGHLEFGESFEDASRREVLEETGLNVNNVQFCTAVNSVVLEHNYHYVTVFMRGELSMNDSSEPQNLEPDKCEGWNWIEWMKMPEPDKLFWPLKEFYSLGINPVGK